MHLYTQSSSDSHSQMNFGEVKENLQSKSKYQKVFDDLKLYNKYQEINNELQSQ